MRAVDAVAFGAEHEIVAGRTPGRLLGDFDVGHAVFGKEALVLGDEQRPGIAQRDKAERRLGDFGPVGMGDVDAEGELRADRAEQRGGARSRFQKRPAVKTAPAVASLDDRHCCLSCCVRVTQSVRPPVVSRRFTVQKTKMPQPEVRSRAFLRTAALLSARRWTLSASIAPVDHFIANLVPIGLVAEYIATSIA